MQQLIRSLTLVTLTCLLVLCQIACTKEPAAEASLTIGAILPLTGDAAQWGVPPHKGAELAIKELSEQAATPALRLAVQDSRCEPRDAVSALNQLMTTEQVPVVLGAVCSSATLAIAPVAERSQVTLVSPASTNPKITDAGEFIFRVIPSDNLRGTAFAEYVAGSRGITRLALLYINNEGGVGNKDTFTERFTELGGEIVLAEAYDQGSVDLRAQLTKIKAADVEGVMVASYPEDTVVVLRQAHELDLGKPLYFQTEAVEDANVLREAGSTAEGVTYILPAEAEGEVPARFRQQYQEAYGSAPELYAAEAYDIVHLVALAAAALPPGQQLTGPGLRDYLLTVQGYEGASGVISFDANGDVLKPMAIKTITGGEPVLVELVGGA